MSGRQSLAFFIATCSLIKEYQSKPDTLTYLRKLNYLHHQKTLAHRREWWMLDYLILPQQVLV